MKLREYSGNTSWRNYQAYYERVAAINGWNKDAMLDFLLINLTGVAQSFVDVLPEHKRSTYDQLCVAFDQCFGAERFTSIHKAKLLSRTRKEGEPLAVLGEDIRCLTQLSYPQFSRDVIEELAVERFLDVLEEADMRITIHQHSPATLEDAIEHGIQLEVLRMADEKKHGRSRARAVKEEEESETEHMVRDLRARLEEMDIAKGRHQITCYNCGKKGHIARKCRAPKETKITCYNCGQKGHTAKLCQATTTMDANNHEYTAKFLANALYDDRENFQGNIHDVCM